MDPCSASAYACLGSRGAQGAKAKPFAWSFRSWTQLWERPKDGKSHPLFFLIPFHLRFDPLRLYTRSEEN